MRKVLLCFCLFTTFLSGCVKEESLGKIEEINAFNAIKRLDQKESMVLVIGTSTCETCIDFHKKMEKYVVNNDVVLYQLLIDNEPLQENDNGEEIRKDFIELENRLVKIESTPTIVWIKNGKMTNTFIGSMDLKDFHEYNKKYDFVL